MNSKEYSEINIGNLIEENEKLIQIIENQSEKIENLQTKINHLSGLILF